MDKIVDKFANFATNTRFSDLPKEIVHETKRVLLDSIGCAINSHSMEMGKISVQLAKRLGGPPESTIIGIKDRVSVAGAAFANGELINAQDFDAGAAGHDTPIVISASLAVAESTGASGKDLILAIAIGHEISARLIGAEGGMITVNKTGPEDAKVDFTEGSGWASTTLAASLSAGKMLNLNQEKMANAIGIAGCICSPNFVRKMADTTPVRMTKAQVFGWVAQASVTAALLAEMGFTGDTDLFSGEDNFWKYTGHPKCNAELVLLYLGSKWLHRINYKQYPCGM